MLSLFLIFSSFMNDVCDIALLNACSLKQCIKMFDVCNCVLGNLFEVD
jgi:hypothetical protein